jgi:hypothetical protein
MNAPAPKIIDTLNDPTLFAPWFPGPSWDAWRTILKSAFAIPLNEGEFETFHALAGDRPPPERQVRELWVIAGRRAGKDSIASVIGAHAAGDALERGANSVRRNESSVTTVSGGVSSNLLCSLPS